MREYLGGFSEWSDVVREFSPYPDSWNNGDGDVVDIPEPYFISAIYENEGYEGSAYVVYFTNGNFYTVSGGHCSCYGLEGQWHPEEYSPKTFKQMVNRMPDKYYSWEDTPNNRKIMCQRVYSAALGDINED